MADFDHYIPPAWTKFMATDDVRSTSWVSISAALEQLSAWEANPQSKAVEYLRSGIWTASFQRARVRSGIVPMSPKGGFNTQLNAVGRGWNNSDDQAIGTGVLTRDFWHKEHGRATNSWTFETGFLWPDGARVEFERGEIEAFHGVFSEEVKDTDFLAFRLTAYGVGVSEVDVDATSPKVARVRGSAVRQTSFDWESAFADVAAELYHDLQFEDVNARGVPSKLVDALRRSFEKRKLQVPEVTSLKSKARILAGALRSKT